jgi:hypothetical protein
LPKREGFAERDHCRKSGSGTRGSEPFHDFRPKTARHESGLQPVRKDFTMPALASTYLVALCAMTFSGLSALTLIYVVNHLDPPDAHDARRETRAPVAV